MTSKHWLLVTGLPDAVRRMRDACLRGEGDGLSFDVDSLLPGSAMVVDDVIHSDVVGLSRQNVWLRASEHEGLVNVGERAFRLSSSGRIVPVDLTLAMGYTPAREWFARHWGFRRITHVRSDDRRLGMGVWSVWLTTEGEPGSLRHLVEALRSSSAQVKVDASVVN